MNILFVMRHAGYVRNFERALKMLAERGHTIHLGFQLERDDEPEVANRLAREYGITYGGVPQRDDLWLIVAYRIRHSIDYLRYLTPFYRNAPKLRARGRKHVPKSLLLLTAIPPLRSRVTLRALSKALRVADRAIPTSAEVDAYIRLRNPDLVLVTPLLAGPTQAEFVRSAHRIGIPTALPVHSWDNLSNKGLIRDLPDRVLVWNEIQRQEAIELHGVPPDRVAVVGAHTYDHWFTWRTSTRREEFCQRVGIDPKRPFVLYLCSSGFIVADERPIVERWLGALREHPDEALRGVGVVVRPHPSTGPRWAEFSLDRFGNAAVWPRCGADPRNASNRNDYFDSLSHAAAVVGINTSAIVEAAIAGARSYTFRLPELFGGQDGTIHFHYLREENGGPLVVGATLDEHLEQLRAALRRGAEPEWNAAFVRNFLRPHGIDVDATPRFVDEVEDLAGVRIHAQSRPAIDVLLVRALLWPLALLSSLVDLRDLRRSAQKSLYPLDDGKMDRRRRPARILPAARLRLPRAGSVRRLVRRLAYRLAHALLPAPVRRELNRALGRSSDGPPIAAPPALPDPTQASGRGAERVRR